MLLNSALSTISFSRVISSGPNVSGRLTPILTPVQPLSLCDAVTIATQGTSRSNCAKYAIEIYPLIDHAYLKAGKTKAEIVKLENFPGFPDLHVPPGPGNRLTGNLGAAYDELTGA